MSLAVPHRRRVPDPRPRGPGLPRHRRHVADVRPVIEAMDRYYETYRATHPPRRLPDRRRGDGRLRGRAREGRRVRGLDRRRDRLHAQRDRGDQPRRVRVGPRERRPGRPRGRSPRWSTTRTSSRGSCVGAGWTYVPMTDDGACSTWTRSTRCSRSRPKLVAVAHVSNVLGTINPIAEIAARAHAAGALVLVDGAQAVPQLPVDVAELDADFYAWTGHKAYGPTGIGVLHGRRELLEAMPPFLGGGHMIARVGDDGVHLGRAARQVRGGHDADRRGDRTRRRGRLAVGHRHGRGARARPRRGRLRARAPDRGPGPDALRPDRPRPARQRSSRSRSTASTRTTSPRSSAARACACAPATTARSR